MNFIALDYEATREIVSSRNLQSSDYDKGRALAELLKTGELEDFSPNIKAKRINNGIYIVCKESTKKALLVFDTTTFKGFERSASEAITILQKSCRLAIKLWDNIGHSPCEKLINNTSFIALLPFSFSTGKSYKVMLDKSPDKERQEKRNESSFLVFHDGYDFASSTTKLSNFRKAKEDLSKLEINDLFIENKVDTQASTSYINIDTIVQSESTSNPHMGLEFWSKNLTDLQKKFVFNKSFGPDILKGAAGTGKTLSLILRCVVQLNFAKESGLALRSLLITHSTATKKNIENLIVSNGGFEYIDSEGEQSVEVTTLQEWCIKNLGNRINATEYLDSDAFEAKQLQLLYIYESLEEFIINDYAGAISFISTELKVFFDKNDLWTISTLLQDEISTYIKGRAGEDLDSYSSLKRTKYSIPLNTDDDYRTIFSIFNKYQQKLIKLNLFDSDDITLSALKETSTPIWKRRRMTTGFDIIYIDETHLFNLNELSLFHNLLKPSSNHIVFTIDRSQATGDSALTRDDVKNELDVAIANEHGLSAVFRSSENIINLASCVLASGALLFQELENPLANSISCNTYSIEEKPEVPYIILKQNKKEMIKASLKLAEHIAQKNGLKTSDVLIIPCTDNLLADLKDHCDLFEVKYSSIENRGDTSVIDMASKNDQFIIGGMEYIGGLEFQAVIILGIDNDKFPEPSSYSGESSHFVSYSSFNKLYVAITRAKNEIAFICEKTQKISFLLDTAIEEGLVVINQELSSSL